MAWYDYLGAAGDTLSDAGTAIHGFQRERRADKREDVLDKRALLQEHQQTQTFLNEQSDRRRNLGKEYYDAADPDQVFLKGDENFQLMYDYIGAKGFTAVPGVPGGMKIIDTPARQLDRLTTEQGLVDVKNKATYLKILNSPGFMESSRANKDRIAALLGYDQGSFYTPEQREAESRISASVISAKIRENIQAALATERLTAQGAADMERLGNQIMEQHQAQLNIEFPEDYQSMDEAEIAFKDTRSQAIWEIIRNQWRAYPRVLEMLPFYLDPDMAGISPGAASAFESVP